MILMFTDSVEGIDQIFHTEVPKGSVILVTGAPGTLKSGLTYNIMSNHIAVSGDFGVYMNLEESTYFHLRNMESLGISKNDDLFISDYTDFRRRFEKDKPGIDFLEMAKGVINFFKDKEGDRFTCLALDSLGALYSIIPVDETLRSRMYGFFQFLRGLHITSFIIMEKPLFNENFPISGSEEFLADGIIEMGMIEPGPHHEVYLYCQVIKMRATSHSRRKHHIEVTSSGIKILGPTFD